MYGKYDATQGGTPSASRIEQYFGILDRTISKITGQHLSEKHEEASTARALHVIYWANPGWPDSSPNAARNDGTGACRNDGNGACRNDDSGGNGGWQSRTAQTTFRLANLEDGAAGSRPDETRMLRERVVAAMLAGFNEAGLYDEALEFG